MKLIQNFAELLHKIKLPSPEKCFVLEEGDDKYIKKWIQNGEITCELEILFKWLSEEYKLKKTKLSPAEQKLAAEVKKRFPMDQWRAIKIFSDHQKKYRYYKRAVEDVKSRTSPRMNEQAIMTIFSSSWGINT